jgi:cholesterol transport system auxiliary component
MRLFLFPSVLLLSVLTACGTAPAARVTVYDFGPGATAPVAANRMAPLPTVLLAEVEAASSLDGTALLYRLGYADAQQPRPYAQARWSMAPAQLLRQRLRETLGQRRSVLSGVDAPSQSSLTLRVELEEFSQWFSAVDASSGLVRVRATLGRNHPNRLLAQTSFVVQQPSASADAAGGARALALATDNLVQQIDTWLQQASAAETAAP